MPWNSIFFRKNLELGPESGILILMKTVLILGASNRPERYAYKAFKMLQKHDYKPLLVNPQVPSVEGQVVLSDLSQVESGSIDTVTLYVGPKILESCEQGLLQLKPRRVIFNPGSEHEKIESTLKNAGIETLQACTLVLLSTNQF
jgi:predicted CoA-binding protein